MTLHPDIVELISLLEKWIALLRRYHGEGHWVAWLEEDVRLLRNSDFRGFEHFRSAFGGMGSITDFSLLPESGSWLRRWHARFVNVRYGRLVSRAQALADTLYREESKGG